MHRSRIEIVTERNVHMKNTVNRDQTEFNKTLSISIPIVPNKQ